MDRFLYDRDLHHERAKAGKVTKRKCRESRENFFATFEQEFAGIKCHENSTIYMSWEFKVAKRLKRFLVCFILSISLAYYEHYKIINGLG